MIRTNLIGIRIIIFLSAILLAQNAFSQKFSLPDIPKYDSIYVDGYKNKIREKSYYLEGEKVFEVGYNTGSMFYTPFAHIGGGKEDSCYAYFNGTNHDHYDFYYISEEYIINRKYAENSKTFKYRKFNWNNVPIENGDYYFIKEMYESTITHSSKYKIGKWVKYDSKGNPIETIDYDNFTLNGKPIEFSGALTIIDSLKSLSDQKIIDVYGKQFFSKYIRLNLDQSGYYPYEKPRPEQPGGYSFLEQTEKKIYFVDFSYDIILGDERFNTIHFRLTDKGEFLGRTYFPGFVTKYFYLTKGLDSLNNGKFHKNVVNWKDIAVKNGFDITSRDFNVRFEFKPQSDYYGELRLILEQVVSTESTKYSYTNNLRQVKINPWTGEMEETADEQGIEMEIGY